MTATFLAKVKITRGGKKSIHLEKRKYNDFFSNHESHTQPAVKTYTFLFSLAPHRFFPWYFYSSVFIDSVMIANWCG